MIHRKFVQSEFLRESQQVKYGSWNQAYKNSQICNTIAHNWKIIYIGWGACANCRGGTVRRHPGKNSHVLNNIDPLPCTFEGQTSIYHKFFIVFRRLFEYWKHDTFGDDGMITVRILKIPLVPQKALNWISLNESGIVIMAHAQSLCHGQRFMQEHNLLAFYWHYVWKQLAQKQIWPEISGKQPDNKFFFDFDTFQNDPDFQKWSSVFYQLV